MSDFTDMLEEDVKWAKKHKADAPEGLAARLDACRKLALSSAGEWISVDDWTPIAGTEVQIAYANGMTSLGYFHYIQERTFVTDLIQRSYSGKVMYWKPKEDGP